MNCNLAATLKWSRGRNDDIRAGTLREILSTNSIRVSKKFMQSPLRLSPIGLLGDLDFRNSAHDKAWTHSILMDNAKTS